VSLGGNYQGWNTPFDFDRAEDGLLAYPHRSFPFVDTKLSSTEEEKATETDSPTEATPVPVTATTPAEAVSTSPTEASSSTEAEAEKEVPQSAA
jgi:hypothetical protein